MSALAVHAYNTPATRGGSHHEANPGAWMPRVERPNPKPGWQTLAFGGRKRSIAVVD